MVNGMAHRTWEMMYTARAAIRLDQLFSAATTPMIAWFTGKPKHSTDKMRRAGEKQIGIEQFATDAAEKSAEFIYRVERAYLLLESIAAAIDWPPTSWDARKSNVTITFKNHGEIPAVIKALYWDVKFGELTSEEANAVHGGPVPFLVVDPGGSYTPPPLTFSVPGESVDAIVSGLYKMCVVGRALYDDALGRHRETHFCIMYREHPNKRFDAPIFNELNRFT